MIVWRNELRPQDQEGITKDPPPGPVQVTRTEQRHENTHIWFAPVPAIPAGDMPPDPVGMLTAMAAMHHEWFEAWQAAGFTEERAFELVLGIVSAAFSQSG